MVVSGSAEYNSPAQTSEVIDMTNENYTCNNFADYPINLSSATGAVLGANIIVCGGELLPQARHTVWMEGIVNIVSVHWRMVLSLIKYQVHNYHALFHFSPQTDFQLYGSGQSPHLSTLDFWKIPVWWT